MIRAVFSTIALAFNADTALLAPWLSLAAGTLATTLPSAPGYIGTFQHFAAEGLAAHGASAEMDADALTREDLTPFDQFHGGGGRRFHARPHLAVDLAARFDEQ